MKSPLLRLFSLTALILTGAALSSCSTVGLGPSGAGEYSGTTINSSNLALIRQTTVAVFAEKGFRLDGSADYGTIRFVKEGTRSAQIAWGSNMNDNPVMVRPEVQINSLGPKTQLICNVYMTQESTVYGENVKQPHLTGKAGYSSILSTIRKRVEAEE
ncbi:hypothetical protein ACFQY0_17735 [Haloferula chungangensis]|uniref:DUF3576 domain-containing protein n=1 Tax=Haloferula chungangensis TaxID=1048331 RepID=A0ABW2LBP5_9BACT